MDDLIHDVLLKAQRSLGIGHPTARAAMAQAAQHIVRQDDEISRLRGEVDKLRAEGDRLLEINSALLAERDVDVATLRATNERLVRSRDRYRKAWEEEKARFSALTATQEKGNGNG